MVLVSTILNLCLLSSTVSPKDTIPCPHLKSLTKIQISTPAMTEAESKQTMNISFPIATRSEWSCEGEAVVDSRG